jgi:hypothetical protein
VLPASPSLRALATRFDVVVPTIGRSSLASMLASLVDDRCPAHRVIVVDDRADTSSPLPVGDAAAALPLHVVSGRAAGPASARNVGWRLADCSWVAFLDDDVRVPVGWSDALLHDLASAEPGIGGNQGRIDVPLPENRPPTDWERNVAGLASARWATADMAYRRSALEDVGGFDERFPRAYREDADLALRVRHAGWALERGRRVVIHPVRRAGAWTSVRLQAGNADDARMRKIHGRGWRQEAEAASGTLARHVATTALGASAVLAAVTGRRRAAALALVGWGVGTATFAWRRIADGPRTGRELWAMAVSSVAIPPAATTWWIRGRLT